MFQGHLVATRSIGIAFVLVLSGSGVAAAFFDGMPHVSGPDAAGAVGPECKVHDHNPANDGKVDKSSCEFQCNANDLVLFFSRADDQTAWPNPPANAVAEVECGGGVDECNNARICTDSFRVRETAIGTCTIWAQEWIEDGFSGWCKSVASSAVDQVCQDVSHVHTGLGEECFKVSGGADEDPAYVHGIEGVEVVG